MTDKYQFVDQLYLHTDNFIKKYGNSYYQLDILQEECAELIQAISKYKRAKVGATNMIIEEMAHVLISTIISAKFIGIEEKDILEEIEKKDRQLGVKSQFKQVL